MARNLLLEHRSTDMGCVAIDRKTPFYLRPGARRKDLAMVFPADPLENAQPAREPGSARTATTGISGSPYRAGASQVVPPESLIPSHVPGESRPRSHAIVTTSSGGIFVATDRCKRLCQKDL